MAIICGTDFSELSERGCEVATALAAKTGEQLVLVHVTGSDGGDKDLSGFAARVRSRHSNVQERLERGDPPVILGKVAAELDANLIVVSSAGRRGSRWALGSTADRTISVASVPVLVVREGFPVADWIGGKRALRVAVATDLSPISDNAAAWARSLSRYGTCEFRVMHVSWPPEAYERLGIGDPMPLDRTHPLVEEIVRQDVAETVARLQEAGRTDVAIDSSFGKPSEALVRLAAEARADLLVVGHKTGRSWRVWEGSVARDVIRSAPISVGCVPDTADAVPLVQHDIDCIVAATDLSPHGNAAVSFALVLARPKSRVIVIHVVEGGAAATEERQRIFEGLSALTIGRDLIERGIDVRIEIVESDEPARAICTYAERESADLVCIASRGRSRLPRILLGSLSQEVLLLSRKPVLIVP